MGNSILARLEHRLYVEKKRRQIKNSSPTIIASNCNGGYILHDLGLRFNTPTINLFFDATDFLKFVSSLDYYLAQELIDTESELDYPVGSLADITIYFMHYATFDEAKTKWNERKKRVNKNNIFVIMTDKNGCTYEQILEFDKLPYQNKVIFTHKAYPDITSAVYIKGFEDAGEVGILSEWKPGFWKRRWLDDFDYVSFLNGSKARKELSVND